MSVAGGSQLRDCVQSRKIFHFVRKVAAESEAQSLSGNELYCLQSVGSEDDHRFSYSCDINSNRKSMHLLTAGECKADSSLISNVRLPASLPI